MLHGPCEIASPKPQCMKGDKCSKHFPNKNKESIVFGENGFVFTGDSIGADMRRKSKRSREDHVFNPLMNSYEGCSEGKIYRLLQMREQMIKLDDKKKAVQRVSLIDDSVQRVVAYFADGLVARLLTKNSPPYNMIMKEPTSEEEFLTFIEMYRVSPYYQFAHFTAN
uniref:Uncharacterized protein n=1 Tax=Salix viminalis TaxID=40686 RepID=A0A6N2LNV0_SALVM